MGDSSTPSMLSTIFEAMGEEIHSARTAVYDSPRTRRIALVTLCGQLQRIARVMLDASSDCDFMYEDLSEVSLSFLAGFGLIKRERSGIDDEEWWVKSYG